MSDRLPDFAALIGSRICHDLISPLGAIGNGVELLSMSGAGGGPELALIADSVANANARIRFFRIAYGAAGDQTLGRAEIVSVLDDLSRGGRLTLHWIPTEPQPRGAVRLAFLALQCLETAMPYGGAVRIDCDGGAWTITGTADKVNLDQTLWAVLSEPRAKAEITPALVQFALLPALAADAGRKVRVIHDGGRITLRL